eukprot:10367117-Lingulodinium_polyedra.AAC.1
MLFRGLKLHKPSPMSDGPDVQKIEDQRETKHRCGSSTTTITDNRRGPFRTEKHQGWGATLKSWTEQL